MRVVVTGGSGLLGASVVRTLLERGHDVVSLDRRPAADNGTETKVVDIADLERLTAALSGADAVVHAASLVDLHLGTPKELDLVNVEGTRNVIAACRAAGVGRLCYVSSAEVITGSEPLRGATEADAPYPRPHLTHYGATKELAERMVLSFNGPDLATCATRTYGLYGEGDRTVVPAYLSHLPTRTIRFIGSPARPR